MSKSKQSVWFRGWIVLLTSAILLSGCGDMFNDRNGGGGEPPTSPSANEEGDDNAGQNMQVSMEAESVPTRKMNGSTYIDLQQFAAMLGFTIQKENDGKTFLIGDTDVEYRLTADSVTAEKEEDPFTLADPLVMANNKPYISATSLVDLFGDAMHYEFSDNGDQLLLYPSMVEGLQMNNQNNQDDKFLDFAEDPDNDDMEVWDPMGEPEAQSVLKRSEVDDLIRTAKKYMGVEYEFGADHYSDSGTFDCSSFVRYVYDKYDVELPRVARNQAKRGESVSRKKLRKGDLLFFYWPGRFKSDNIVGHVGIYIGDNKMLHSSPEPKDGVQISNINDSRWKETFLKARRFVD